MNLKNSHGTKSATFPNSTVSTKFPDNVVLLKNKSVAVCLNLVEHPETNVLAMICKKFEKLENAFDIPYSSSRFHTNVGSHLSERYDEYNVNQIKAKMVPLPFLPSDCSKLADISERSPTNKWFLSALQHTVAK